MNYTRQLVIATLMVFCCIFATRIGEGIMMFENKKGGLWLKIRGFSGIKVTTHCVFIFLQLLFGVSLNAKKVPKEVKICQDGTS